MGLIVKSIGMFLYFQFVFHLSWEIAVVLSILFYISVHFLVITNRKKTSKKIYMSYRMLKLLIKSSRKFKINPVTTINDKLQNNIIKVSEKDLHMDHRIKDSFHWILIFFFVCSILLIYINPFENALLDYFSSETIGHFEKIEEYDVEMETEVGYEYYIYYTFNYRSNTYNGNSKISHDYADIIYDKGIENLSEEYRKIDFIKSYPKINRTQYDNITSIQNTLLCLFYLILFSVFFLPILRKLKEIWKPDEKIY